MRYSPIALVLVLIAIAIAWDAGEPDEDPHAARPLQGDYEERRRTHAPPPQPPMPELPVYDPAVDDHEYRTRNADDDYELHEEIANDLAGGSANLDVDEIREVLNSDELPGANDPGITARRLLATLNRRRQQLGLVERLLDQVLPEIEMARESGDDERAEWLGQTRERLELRRNSIVESITEMADVPDDVLDSNEELRTAIEDIRGYQPSEQEE